MRGPSQQIPQIINPIAVLSKHNIVNRWGRVLTATEWAPSILSLAGSNKELTLKYRMNNDSTDQVLSPGDILLCDVLMNYLLFAQFCLYFFKLEGVVWWNPCKSLLIFPLGCFFAEGIYCLSYLRLFVCCLMRPWEMFPGIRTRSTQHLHLRVIKCRQTATDQVNPGSMRTRWRKKGAGKDIVSVFVKKKVGHHKRSTKRQHGSSVSLS